MTYIQQIAQHCIDLHPEAETWSDAVFAYQKDLQKLIELKKELDISAKEEIALWFELFKVWNELKAQELQNNNGGINGTDNNSDRVHTFNRLVLVGDQTCGDLSGAL